MENGDVFIISSAILETWNNNNKKNKVRGDKVNLSRNPTRVKIFRSSLLCYNRPHQVMWISSVLLFYLCAYLKCAYQLFNGFNLLSFDFIIRFLKKDICFLNYLNIVRVTCLIVLGRCEVYVLCTKRQ